MGASKNPISLYGMVDTIRKKRDGYTRMCTDLVFQGEGSSEEGLSGDGETEGRRVRVRGEGLQLELPVVAVVFVGRSELHHRRRHLSPGTEIPSHFRIREYREEPTSPLPALSVSCLTKKKAVTTDCQR